MTRDELIKQCRYYKGEEECSFDGIDQDKTLFWSYEETWVNNFKGDYIDEQLTQSCYLALSSVANANKGEFSSVPVSLSNCSSIVMCIGSVAINLWRKMSLVL